MERRTQIGERRTEVIGGAQIVLGGLMQIWPNLLSRTVGAILIVLGGLTIVYAVNKKSWPGLESLPRWQWAWSLQLNRDSRWPFWKSISLEDAAKYAYGQLHGTMIVDVAETPILGEPANPPRYIATHMVKTLIIPLYGYKPHSDRLEQIREEDVNWHEISDDLHSLEEGSPKGAVRKYERLRMRASDVKQYVKEQKARND